MSADPSTVKWAARPNQLAVKLDDPFWDLLERYLRIINKKLKEKGKSRINKARLVEAIVCYVLSHHEKTILDDHSYNRVAQFTGSPGIESLLRSVTGKASEAAGGGT